MWLLVFAIAVACILAGILCFVGDLLIPEEERETLAQRWGIEE